MTGHRAKPEVKLHHLQTILSNSSRRKKTQYRQIAVVLSRLSHLTTVGGKFSSEERIAYGPACSSGRVIVSVRFGSTATCCGPCRGEETSVIPALRLARSETVSANTNTIYIHRSMEKRREIAVQMVQNV